MDRVDYRNKVNCSWDEWAVNYHCWEEGCEDVIPALDNETMEEYSWWWKYTDEGWKAYCSKHSIESPGYQLMQSRAGDKCSADLKNFP